MSILQGCKYDEGPAMSFRSAKERASNNWRFSRFILGNDDYTSENNSSRLSLLKSGDATLTTDFASYTGSWFLSNKNEKININISGEYWLDDTWYEEKMIFDCTILMLKEKEMHLSGTLKDNLTYDGETDSYNDACKINLIGTN